MIKQIFLDMDGTLLNNAGQVSAENIRVIRESQIPLSLVSARAPLEMAAAIDDLGLTTTQIGFNGGLIYRRTQGKLQVLESHFIPSQTSSTLLRWLKENFPSVSCSYYTKDAWLTEQIDAGIEYETGLTGITPTLTTSQTLRTAAQAGIFKIMLIVFDQQTMLKLQSELLTLNLKAVAIQQSGTMYLEITSKNAVKARGIEYIMQEQHISQEETAAFGDGHNDLPMLQAVGTPIVMGNALDVIKSAGKFVTKTNDEDGVAYGITHFISQLPNEQNSELSQAE
ncbi:haloacid dehalogenase [Ligilactobacillus salitolerans]|uniref:Haloacid dehalogenase n=1 Tax=Ligilactobacillus salitolerans TaxID=1808352 RepID=A0A401IQS3_9LACO|nr:Cof-type HAD-IIB family hydrolase [Ligilactobacillus salitolerans]GBG93872.1 haloacid dehalogenase [Ligilactobacillus salitolerans]